GNSRFHSHFSLVRPLSGPSRAALPAALPDALHAPPPQAPFQPVKGPLCPLAHALLFHSSRLFRTVYYHSPAPVSRGPAGIFRMFSLGGPGTRPSPSVRPGTISS